MGCCCCQRGGCCCCGKRGATITFGLLGLLLAAGVIAPPVYIYMTDGDYVKLFPMIGLARQYLQHVTDINAEEVKTNVTEAILPKDETYRLAIFQLLDDTESWSPYMAFFSFCVGCLNIPFDILLIFGAVFRSPCCMLPWLFITLAEHLVVGIPLIVYFGLISLYLAAQLQMYIVGGLLIGTAVVVFFVSLSSWVTAYACFKMFSRGDMEPFENTEGTTCDPQLTQPLLHDQQGPPPLPAGHPAGQSGFHMNSGGQYPYYPPHSSRQLPSAPPQASHGMYPHLPNA